MTDLARFNIEGLFIKSWSGSAEMLTESEYTVPADHEAPTLPQFVQKTTTKVLITTVTLACVHIKVAMRECKLVRRQSTTQNTTLGNTINKSTEETYEKYFTSCCCLWCADLLSDHLNSVGGYWIRGVQYELVSDCQTSCIHRYLTIESVRNLNIYQVQYQHLINSGIYVDLLLLVWCNNVCLSTLAMQWWTMFGICAGRATVLVLKYSLRGYEGQRQMLTSCSLFLLRYAVHVDNADFRYVHIRSLCRNSYYINYHFFYIEIIACNL